MRNVARTVLTTAAMLIAFGAAAAQSPEGLRKAVLITEFPAAPSAAPARSPQIVIERLRSFDANADHRITRDELPERMHGLLARGDRNADAALDSDEIRALVNAESSEGSRISFRFQTSEGLSDVIRDLKLPSAKHEHALAIVAAQQMPRNPNDLVSADLAREMRSLLDDEEYENFMAAARRLSRSPQFRFRGTVGGITSGRR